MKKILKVLILVLLSQSAVSGAQYFVSPNGSDTNPGTRKNPFRHINKAASIMEAGDTCIIGEGTYRESVNVKHSGKPNKPIRFIAVEGEQVIIDGTELIEGRWKKHEGGIWKIPFDGKVEQLFVDGQMMVEARWPNMRMDQTYDRSCWAESVEGSRFGELIDPELAKTGIDWTGAIAMLNVAHQFYTWTKEVKYEPGSDRFSYEKDFSVTKYTDTTKGWEDDYYFLFGKLEALDIPTEWYHDQEAGVLYLYPPEGMDLNDCSISCKKRDFGVTATSIDYIEIKNIGFFGCAFELNKANHCVVDGCQLMFSSFSRLIGNEDRQATISGNRNVVRNTEIGFCSGMGLKVEGLNNLMENNIIHDVCWTGTLRHPALRVKGEGVGTGSIIRNNTLYNGGNSMLAFSSADHLVEHNHVYNGGKLCRDVSLLYTQQPECSGTVIRFNWVHGIYTEGYSGDSYGGMGIRGDDQTRNLTVHNNVVWDCGGYGIIVKGDYNRIFNNTVFDIKPLDREIKKRQDLVIPTIPEKEKYWREQHDLLPVQNANSFIANNVVGAIAWRKDPIKNEQIVNNLEIMEPVEKWLQDPKFMDFRPKPNSPLIDTSKVVKGINDKYVGEGPDLGAYELGCKHWKAGATIKEGRIF